MANIQIPNLPPVISLNGSELLEAVQTGASVRVSLGQILAAAAAGTPTSFPVPIAVGGTGASTASGARTNLGLGTIAVQSASAVTITGGTINGTNVGGVTPAVGSFTIGTFDLGTAILPSIAFIGDTNTGIWSPTANALAISTDGVERMRIDSAGDVGIGTSAPSRPLHIVRDGATLASAYFQNDTGSTAIFARSEDTGSNTLYFGDTTNFQSGFLQYSHTNDLMISRSAGSILFQTGGATERVRINSDGDVGIGTNNPAVKLDVLGDGLIQRLRSTTSTASYLRFDGTGTSFPFIGLVGGIGTFGNTDANPIRFNTNTLERYRIGEDGQWGIGGANYGTTGQTIVSGGASTAPAWGTLGISGGGTGVTTAPAAAAVLYGYTSTATAAGTTVLTNTSSQYQLFTGVTTQTITLPVTSTLTTGWTFHIVNNSTGNLTVNSSGANLVATVPANMTLMVTCILTSGTTAASWEWGFTDFGSITGTGSVVLGTGPTITNGALNGTVGATTPSTGAFTTVTATTSILSPGAGGIGYSTGAGVAVTQPTSRTTPTPTTGNKTSGAITLFTAAPVLNAWVSFTVPNTAIAITDTVSITVRGATNTYIANVTAIVAATSFTVTIASVLGTASDTPIINFNIIRGVSS